MLDNLHSPMGGETFPDGVIQVSGRIQDDVQVTAAQVAIVDSQGRYMGSSGTFTSTNQSWRSAFLNSPGSDSSNYSYTTPVLPAGTYTVRVRGVDNHNQATVTPTDAVVTVTLPPNNPPVAAFTTSCQQQRVHVRRTLLDRRGSCRPDVRVELRSGKWRRRGGAEDLHGSPTPTT